MAGTAERHLRRVRRWLWTLRADGLVLTYAHETHRIFLAGERGGIYLLGGRIPAAISQGENFAEAKANLLDALKLGLEGRRNLVEKDLSPEPVRESIELADA